MYYSIVIPTLNSENTLSFALESIMQQKCHDLEVLIIDGQSYDSTLDIARKFRDKRIHIVSEMDNGIYDAINKGIKMSKGEWLYFLGSDDKLFDSYVLESIHNETYSNRYDIIYGDVNSSRFNGRYDGEFDYLKLISKNICHQALFFKKTIFKRIGLYNLNYKSHADWDHNLRWFLNKHIRKKYIDLVIAEYGDGGFSSVHPDEIFARDKNMNIIKYGLSSLPSSIIRDLSGQEYQKAISSGKLTTAILFKTLNLYSRVCLRFQ
jgi:glycosyltransferase involved in cell wall biosynthesis